MELFDCLSRVVTQWPELVCSVTETTVTTQRAAEQVRVREMIFKFFPRRRGTVLIYSDGCLPCEGHDSRTAREICKFITDGVESGTATHSSLNRLAGRVLERRLKGIESIGHDKYE